MKTNRMLATLLLLATLTACAPSAEPSVEPSAEPSAATTTEPTAVSDFDYRRYTNPQSSYYPEWAQPYSLYVYGKPNGDKTETTRGEFLIGGYLTKKELEAEPEKTEHFMDYDYMTPAKQDTMISYDENGHIMTDSLLYDYTGRKYNIVPPPNTSSSNSGSVSIEARKYAMHQWSSDYAELSYDEYFSELRAVGGRREVSAQLWDENDCEKLADWAAEHADDTFASMLERNEILSGFALDSEGEIADMWYSSENEIESVCCTDGDAIYFFGADGTSEKLYTADGFEIMTVAGDSAVVFFMTDAYDIYRLHASSEVLDFMCNAEYDFELGIRNYDKYIVDCEWQNARNYPDEADRYRDFPSFYEWIGQTDLSDKIEQGRNVLKRYLPVSGYFEVISNSDVRFTVMGGTTEWNEPLLDDQKDWFSNANPYDDVWFYGDYVTYSSVLKKYGMSNRAYWWLLPRSEDMERMSYDEFVDYFGGLPFCHFF